MGGKEKNEINAISTLVEIEVGVELGYIEHEVRENFVGRGGQKFSGGVPKNVGM